MKKVIIAMILIGMVFGIQAASIDTNQVVLAVKNWIEAGDVMESELSPAVKTVETHTIGSSGTSVHVVNLSGGGYVVTAADDGLEPILAFSDTGEWIASDENPLWVLLKRDIANRMRILSSTRKALSVSNGMRNEAAGLKNRTKWQRLLTPSVKPTRQLTQAKILGVSSVSDVRIPAMVKSKWDQTTVKTDSSIFGDSYSKCYNLYTPHNYPCGCVATAMAQVMRYHEYPSGYVTPKTFGCGVDDDYIELTMKGGIYNWDNMPLTPSGEGNSDSSSRASIGKLTYDCGVSVGMNYANSGSGAYMDEVPDALMHVFGYASAQYGYWFNESTLFANLDAGFPVLWSIDKDSGDGHAVIADGYGYSSDTLYVHINMGWNGTDNAWYNPYDAIGAYTEIDSMVYDIFPVWENRVILSGRVTDEAGLPVKNALVSVETEEESVQRTVTNKQGIYSFLVPYSYYRYATITVRHNGFEDSSSTYCNESSSGNDFVIRLLADALDCEKTHELTFTTDPTHPWFRITGETLFKGDAAQSGELSANQNSWMEAETYSNGKITFVWKVSSEENFDKLVFTVDGLEVASISGTNSDWHSETFCVKSNDDWDDPHLLRWNYSKNDSGSSGQDCGWVDHLIWQREVPISFYANYHDSSGYHSFSTNIIYYENDAYDYLPTPPKREGYKFEGWYNRESVWDTDLQRYVSITNRLSEDAIVHLRCYPYAEWTPNHYFVLFHANDTSGRISAQPHVYDTELPLAPNDFTREGYVFQGWSLTPDGEVLYEEGAIVKNLTAEENGAFSLYAVWIPATKTSGVPVPYEWLDAYGLVENGDYETAANRTVMKAGDVSQPVWQDYLTGTDPTDPDSRFIAQIFMSNGKPFVTWSPDLTNERRIYTIIGKKSLSDETWQPVPEGGLSDFRFFKVKVELLK
ncbi:MAG: C10 family peptidase [Kiritimatiellae bacterium]|nr:C10 family peptidase [Kiritimatiellia bacterium]